MPSRNGHVNRRVTFSDNVTIIVIEKKDYEDEVRVAEINRMHDMFRFRELIKTMNELLTPLLLLRKVHVK